MQDITELRDRLTELYEKASNRQVPISLAKELANIAGKIINSLAVELNYNHYMEITKKIEFLEQKISKHSDTATETLLDEELNSIINSK